MSFGFAIGDFIAVGNLAWTVYKSCKGAPGSFQNISSEVLSLHALLQETREALSAHPLPVSKQANLGIVLGGCQGVLDDLQSLIEKYKSLGTQSKRTWDRLGISQISVEQKLDEFLREFREGRREGSVVTTQTVESLSADDRETWRLIRKELEEIGITVAAFEANKSYIINWFAEAVSSGAFTEEAPYEGATMPQPGYLPGQIESPQQSESYQSADQTSGSASPVTAVTSLSDLMTREREPQLVTLQPRAMPPLEYLQGRVEPSQQLESSHQPDIFHHPGSSQSAGSISSSASPVIAVDSVRDVTTLEGDPHWATLQLKGNVLSQTATRGQSEKRPRVPRLAALIARLSSPESSFNFAVQEGSYRKVVRILSDEAKSSFIDQETLNKALHISCMDAKSKIAEFLLARGADVNSLSPATGLAPLHEAVNYRTNKITHLLINHGANINIKSQGKSSYGYTPLHFAAEWGDYFRIKTLLEARADVKVLDTSGSSALRLYVRNPFCRTVFPARMLLEEGADANSGPPGEPSLLQIAVQRRMREVVRVLLDYGADLPTGEAALEC
ncbi:hypothetical protein MMC30_003661 [Trapelia coarctata]|nr:hypothetical protein [Trapelia coarctata]